MRAFVIVGRVLVNNTKVGLEALLEYLEKNQVEEPEDLIADLLYWEIISISEDNQVTAL